MSFNIEKMKIQPLINFKFYTPQQIQEKKQYCGQNVSDNTSILKTFIHYPINFSGTNTDFQNHLLALDGIHCPCCGEETLSAQKASEIIKAAAKAKTLQQYSKVFNDNSEYFHSKFHPFIRSLNRLNENCPEKSISDAIKILRNGSSKLILNTMHDQANYLKKLDESPEFSKSDKEKIKLFADYLSARDRLPKKDEYNEILGKTLCQLESDKRKDILIKVNNRIISAYNCRGALSYNPELNKDLPERASIVKTMLSYSQSNLAKLYNNKPDNLRFNNIILCKECHNRYKTFNYIINSPQAEENINHYVEDIANAINNNRLGTEHNKYLYDFISAVNSFNAPNLNIKRNVVSGIVQSKIFSERKRDYMFEQYSGVPCASCGTITINHDEKMALYNEIKNCENTYELYNLVRLNKHHIVPKYKKIFARFEKLLNENPNITEDEIMKQLQIDCKKDINKYMNNICTKIEHVVESGDYSFVEKAVINDFIYSVKENFINVPYNKEFRYDDFSKLTDSTLGKLHHPDKVKLVSIAKDKLKEIYMQDYIVHPPDAIVNTTGSKVKAIFQNIFKMSIITADHMDALDLGGANEYYNKIGLCKDCNHEKGRSTMKYWAQKHPEINRNLPKHLKYISEIIKREKIKEMYNYPEQAAKQAIHLGKGKIHIQTDYGLKD